MLTETIKATITENSPSILSSISSLSSNPHVIGSSWVLSSAILTTYSTTSFLKYEDKVGSPTTLPLLNAKSKQPAIATTTSATSSSLISSPKKLQPLQQQQQFPFQIDRPALLILYRFSGSLLFGTLFHPQIFQIRSRIQHTLKHVPAFTFPALFLFLANYSNSIALNRIGISLTYTSKCGIPLMTVLFTVLLDGWDALPNIKSLLSLIPIVLGIAAASWNSPTFETLGFGCALISCTAQAALNVSSKRVLRKFPNMSGLDAQRAMVTVALGVTIVVQVMATVIRGRFLDGSNDSHSKSMSSNSGDVTSSTTRSSRKPRAFTTASKSISSSPPLGLTILAVISYHIEYVLSFMFVKLVEPITYGTCDAIRRLSIIVTGQRMFGGEPFSRFNIGGIGLALTGALLYSFNSNGGNNLK